ncbi:hypothetical protein PFLUV_G00144270 [Perca fluviatilis]|uniref:Uncharacterized protein n=1 Tax=Perca fluviatilis TaxID=8168 RepID=A0A6A5EVC3_PERFL|nr:hypothetical protein PFLUV_G00144270 [Perca fluviatilis]
MGCPFNQLGPLVPSPPQQTKGGPTSGLYLQWPGHNEVVSRAHITQEHWAKSCLDPDKATRNKSFDQLASCVGQLLEALCHETSSDGWISTLIHLM